MHQTHKITATLIQNYPLALCQDVEKTTMVTNVSELLQSYRQFTKASKVCYD